LEKFNLADSKTGRRRGDCSSCAWKKTKARQERDPAKYKELRRVNLLKYKYKIEPTEYDRLFEEQAGACAICKDKVDYLLYVDHDHGDGRVRGLLCQGCNSVLGYAKDKIETLVSAIEYLRRAEASRFS
jgi:hypothetical protein